MNGSGTAMRAYLVRVAVDQTFGGWNSPVDPETNEFVYVPIPEQRAMRAALATPYSLVQPALARFTDTHPAARSRSVQLPSDLTSANMHLDPDFEHLTYGDNGVRRGKGLAGLGRRDIVVFYSGLRPVAACQHRLVYALVGLYRVREVVRLESVAAPRWSENAHTRCIKHVGSDVIVRAERGSSGRLRRCIPIGEFRDGAYRLTHRILEAWGGLSCRDGYLQRSAVPPSLLDPRRFINWFERQGAELVNVNNL
ncbi:MAG: hypothetical protein Q8S00_10785 [Deltaproteobacteria bacterium]|nr:hypothetical protein [Deltaproteobacteria bacterium]